jgi:chorismate dehydratase
MGRSCELNGSSERTPVRLGRIAYVNVDPIYYGLERAGKPDWLEIVGAPPALLNRHLAQGSLDISAVSAFAYAEHREDWLLLPDFCIACSGNVLSVLLVSRHPMEALSGRRIQVSDESATAVSLVRLVLKMRGITPVYEIGKIRSPADVGPEDGAALVIGDTALRENWHDAFAHVWDLGDLWTSLTGLPFVFALWAVRRSFAQCQPRAVSEVLDLLRASRRAGMANLDSVSTRAASVLGVNKELCDRYFANFRYEFDPSRIRGLETFFHQLHRQGFFSTPVPLRFFGVS